MKEILITDFLENNYTKNYSNKYLELPVFDKKFNLKKNIIFYKKWNNYEKKINDTKENLRLYNHFLDQLIIFLNNYHKRNYSKKYWSIVLGQWLYRFISAITFKWNLINSIDKKYIFVKKGIDLKDVIPLGIEDYQKIKNTHYWSHYCYSRIIEYSFSNKFLIKYDKDKIKNFEREKIYNNLSKKNFKEEISLLIQKILNFLPQNKSILIFSTYMSNLDEIKLNLLLNKSFLYYKSPRPYLLFKKKKMFQFERRKFEPLISRKSGVSEFLSIELLRCLPSAYLENFEIIGSIVSQISFPKSPQKIFTTLGINRSTLMDRYIAENVENGSSLILAQHGGAYFQEKLHFSSIYELKISDKYLSWGNVKKTKVSPIGIIKNINVSSKISNKIILEVRMRKSLYQETIKIDSGFSEGKRSLENLCKFFSLLKGKKICKNLYVKLHETKSIWQEKKQFLSHNPNLKFLDEKKLMIKEISSAKLIIHTYCGTGHLECLAINKPTLILFVHNINLFDEKSKNYIKKFIKLGIVHKTPQSLFKMLKSFEHNKSIEKWWNLKKRQKLLNSYRKEFGFFNKEKLSNLTDILNEK